VHELTYCRIADSFIRYLGALVSQVLVAEPLLRFHSPGDDVTPISEQVEAEVRSLTGGVRQFAQRAKKLYGMTVFPSKPERIAIEWIIETRHVFTHNHGLLRSPRTSEASSTGVRLRAADTS
jgi:hypothetical protein